MFPNADFDVIRVGRGQKQFDVVPRVDFGGTRQNQEFSVPSTVPYAIPSSNIEHHKDILDLEKNIFSIELDKNQTLFGRELEYSKIFDSLEPSLASEVIESDEKNLNTASASTSLLRAPGKMEDFIFGSSNNVPFLPGGFEASSTSSQPQSTVTPFSFDSSELEFESIDLKFCPPGFSKGLKFVGSESQIVENTTEQSLSSTIKQEDDININQGVNSQVNQNQIISEDEELISQSRFESNSSIMQFHQIFQDNEDAITFSSDEEDDDEDNEKEIENEENKGNSVLTETNQNNKPEGEEETVEELLEEVKEWDSIYSKRLQKKKEKNKNTWAVQLNMNMDHFHDEVPEMAIQYPFELDTFQKEAVYHLEKGESVFVAAHTSAGKTVVAEYAIALSKKHMTRAIYTSPIKALSNQKFRDFKETFGEVGLITGDVQINPEASCLIVTTEILRSMLYKGADLLRDVEWVIFDEVHYINDLSRGVVWEEVIIMLPARVNIILLSATVPNTLEFADWIGRTKKKQIYVVSTLYRPTPLEHYLCVKEKIFKIVSKDGDFVADGFIKATKWLEESTKKTKSKQTQYNNNKLTEGAEKSYFTKLVKLLQKNELLPVVIFAFSKKKCDSLAYGLQNIDLTSSNEKSEIHVFINSVINRLNVVDRKLPQVLKIKELLKRGIGVHHSGLLPIIKEMVEILFGRGLCKILFATETFAMGVNMPARTVVFHSIRKHDGNEFRNLLSGEYIQMSGRAGRRGLDSVGRVIIACSKQIPDRLELVTVLTGKIDKLESKFRLTYNMILNLIRVQDFRVQDMIKRSFSEVITQKEVPEQLELLKKAKTKLQDIEDIHCIFGEPTIDSYYDIYIQIKLCVNELYNHLAKNKLAQKLFTLGRLVQISTPNYRNHMGIILQKLSKGVQVSTGVDIHSKSTSVHCFSVLVPASDHNTTSSGKSFEIIDVPATSIFRFFKEKISNIDPHSIGNDVTMSKAAANISTLFKKHQNNSFPVLGPKDFKINDLEFSVQSKKKESLLKQLERNQCHTCPKLEEHYKETDKKQRLINMISHLQFSVSDDNLLLLPEFENRMKVLRKLNYIDETNAIQLKGRVARELNTVQDELIATEMVFGNLITDLQPAEIVSLISTLIFQEKRVSEPKLTETLHEVYQSAVALAEGIGSMQAECGLDIAPAEYAREKINFGLMEVVYEWARGVPFADICLLTDVLEGSIVRCIVRLEEACREFKNVARIVGNIALQNKLEEASHMIKRDIVFASSLYTQ